MNSVLMNVEPVVLESVCNFRDLGGLKTRDGRTVKSGMIFRSDELSRLSDRDLQYLADISLRTIVDLRTDWEIKRCPDRKPATVCNAVICSMDTPRCLTAIENLHDDKMLDGMDADVRNMLGDVDAKMGTLPEEQIRSTVIKLYERMTTELDFIEAFRRIFALLLQEENVPLLFHCMAGKDRTGVVAALILSAIGVDEETIMADYLISNIVAGKKYAKQIALNRSLRYLYETHPEFLDAAFSKIKRDHGSTQRFLCDTLGVDLEKIQQRYLV